MNTTERLALGHSRTTAPEEAQRNRVASGFRYDPRMEELATLADRDPVKFDRIPTTVRMQLGFYANAKAAAAEAGIDTSPPKDTP